MKNLFKEDLLDSTQKGLAILKKYITTPFKVGKTVKKNGIKFNIRWDSSEYTYKLNITGRTNTGWLKSQTFDAYTFVQSKFQLTEEETNIKIDKELDLKLFNYDGQKIDFGVLPLNLI